EADATRGPFRCFDSRDPISTRVRRHSGGMGGRPPTERSSEVVAVGGRSRRKPTRSAHGPGSQTRAAHLPRQYADTRGVWGVVPPPSEARKSRVVGGSW